jgi:hypothetical protein
MNDLDGGATSPPYPNDGNSRAQFVAMRQVGHGEIRHPPSLRELAFGASEGRL